MPTFKLTPPLTGYQMVAYANGPELEFNIPARTERRAIANANFQAMWSKRHRFMLRDGNGFVVYDGPVLDALGRPIYFRDGFEVYADREGYADLAAADASVRELAA